MKAPPLLAALLAACIAAGPSCRRAGPPAAVGAALTDAGAAVADAAAAAAPARYTVRGEVVQLPRPGGAPELLIRHEPIDEFADRTGKVVGMASMVMGFRVEPPLSTAGLEPGDKVLLRFAVDWERPAMTVERLERLSPDVVLRFGPAGDAGVGAP